MEKLYKVEIQMIWRRYAKVKKSKFANEAIE